MKTRRNHNLEKQSIYELMLADQPSSRPVSKRRRESAHFKEPVSKEAPKERRRIQIEKQLRRLEHPSRQQTPTKRTSVLDESSSELQEPLANTLNESGPTFTISAVVNTASAPPSKLEEEKAALIEQQRHLIDRYQDLLMAATAPVAAPQPVENLIDFTTAALPLSDTPMVMRTTIVKNRFLVLDTEAFRVPSELSSQTILPLQIAWAIYEWGTDPEFGGSLNLITKRTAYVSNVMCTSRFRDAIRAVSERCFIRHEAKIKQAQYPMMEAKAILDLLQSDIFAHSVGAIAAYNISWDFEAIGNVIRLFYPDGGVPQTFDAQCDNPFNRFGLSYVDLMHEVIKKYGERLVVAGISDGTVHRNDRGKIMLRKNERYSKTVYSAEYALYRLFNITQQHLADEDVDHEAYLLEAVLQEFGLEALEYNVMYPQQNSYEKMAKLAAKALKSDEADEEAEASLTEEEVVTAAATQTKLQRVDTPYPKGPKGPGYQRYQEPTKECLFTATDSF